MLIIVWEQNTDGHLLQNKPAKTSKIASQLRSQDMAKPQLQFEHMPTNAETGPFKPLLLSKPHAIVPLEPQPVATDQDSQAQYASYVSIYSCLALDYTPIHRHIKPSKRKFITANFASRYSHPYQLEIEQYRYPTSVYTQADPMPYRPFDSTTATFVDTEEAVSLMLAELKQAKEIAIDLEHHHQRSYVGMVSLMQISTRDQDWIVDTLKPWRRKLQVLNEVFADPDIVKVLHGAYMDIVWLQRDLGLYIVGLFDTHYAARALGYAGGSLAFLLKKFVNFDAQKQYQMADWRVRPLPQELFDYARSDTHYLLYIYDCMRNELIQRSDFSLPNHDGDKLWTILLQSSETALQRYQHPVYDTELGQGPIGWYKMLARTPALFTKEQFAVFKAVHKWRDTVARDQDDSVHYILPNSHVFSIAREMPHNRAALLGVAQHITQTLRLRADELVGVINKATEDGKTGPEMWDVLNKVEPQRAPAANKAIPTRHSIAAFVPSKTTTSNDVNGDTSLPLRSGTSAFWGGAFESSAHHQSRTMSSSAVDIELKVPMPALTEEVFANPPLSSPAQGEPAPEPASAPSSTPAEMIEDDDVFVLKELGKKRKRAAYDDLVDPEVDSMATQNDEFPISDEGNERTMEKAERRRAKKEAKRAAKRASEVASDDANGANGAASGIVADAEVEPFDYASAPSILNAPRESREQFRERKKKEVNPYAKSLDAPRGLARSAGTKERAGKSRTFQQ